MDLTQVVKGLGGADNITDILACSTRIRVEIIEPAKIAEKLLRSSGALGIVRAHHVVQIVVGAEATKWAGALQEMIAAKA